MSGPLSVPAGDKQLYEELRTLKCDRHGEYCWGGKNDCVLITLREWLYKRHRLVTGKSR